MKNKNQFTNQDLQKKIDLMLDKRMKEFLLSEQSIYIPNVNTFRKIKLKKDGIKRNYLISSSAAKELMLNSLDSNQIEYIIDPFIVVNPNIDMTRDELTEEIEKYYSSVNRKLRIQLLSIIGVALLLTILIIRMLYIASK